MFNVSFDSRNRDVYHGDMNPTSYRGAALKEQRPSPRLNSLESAIVRHVALCSGAKPSKVDALLPSWGAGLKSPPEMDVRVGNNTLSFRVDERGVLCLRLYVGEWDDVGVSVKPEDSGLDEAAFDKLLETFEAEHRQWWAEHEDSDMGAGGDL